MVGGDRADGHILEVGVETGVLHLHAHSDAEPVRRLAAADGLGRNGIVVPHEIGPQIFRFLIRQDPLPHESIEQRTAVLRAKRRGGEEHAAE